MASISGNVTVTGDPDDWIATAFDADTHAYAGVAAVSEGGYTISGLTAGKAYVVACRPKTGPVWAASRETLVDNYVVPASPASTPYIFKATTAPVGDADFASVSLLLHCDGTNNSTTFTDVTGKTVTAGGNAKISTTQSKFGGASAAFDGNGDYLRVPYATSLDLGSGDFTVEAFIYVTAYSSGYACLCGTYTFGTVDGGSQNSGWLVGIGPTGKLLFGWGNNGAFTTLVESSGAVGTGAWKHVAVVRSGTALKLYINGTNDGSATKSDNITVSKSYLYVGSYNRSDTPYQAANSINGYIDEVRITKGVARYTGSSLTPPSAAFLDQASAKTGSSEPAWGTTPDSTTEDDGVTWTNMGRLIQPLMQGPLIAA